MILLVEDSIALFGLLKLYCSTIPSFKKRATKLSHIGFELFFLLLALLFLLLAIFFLVTIFVMPEVLARSALCVTILLVAQFNLVQMIISAPANADVFILTEPVGLSLALAVEVVVVISSQYGFESLQLGVDHKAIVQVVKFAAIAAIDGDLVIAKSSYAWESSFSKIVLKVDDLPV